MPTLPNGTISASGVWKRFHADRSRGLLRDEIEGLRRRLRGEPSSGWRWALRDVDLHAKPGESIGIVGLNGSGKSTLLKILTRVMYPHSGSVAVAGRVGALIEVVSGIHHELTGRENLYLYGSLMGLSRSQVTAKFDELVAFAELENAIDRQVKFYSLGMQMRLGFAVAAFLDADALLVDEVLAVGDAAFQQKCLNRMRTVLNQGTTLILVSHDLAAIEATCARGVWLRSGRVAMDGPIREVLRGYRASIEDAAHLLSREASNGVRIARVEVHGGDGGGVRTGEEMEIAVAVQSDSARYVMLGVGVSEGPASPIWVVQRALRLISGETEARCSITHVPLPRGRYAVWACLYESPHGSEVLPWHPIAQFDVYGPDLDPAPLAVVRLAPVHVESVWDVSQVREVREAGRVG